MRHTTTAALFQHSLQTTDRWLKQIMVELGWDDQHKAYTALRATLHALREQLPVDECAQLSAQLPLVLRGVYWEGWNPTCTTPTHDAFLTDIHAAFRHNPNIDPEQVARAFFKALAKEISAGEMEDVRSILPRDIRRLAPSPVDAGERLSARHREPVMLEAGDVGAAYWGA